MPKIEIKDLTVEYKSRAGAIRVLDNLDVTFQNGKFSSILGYTGSGKTTLLRTIIGLLPYEGSIFIDGVDQNDTLIKDKNIAYVSQECALYHHLSVFDNIAFPLKLIKASREEIIQRVNEVADTLGIRFLLSRKPRVLSGGQQQKVALAKALIKRPNICILDEPFSNLDEKTRTEFKKLIKNVMSDQKITVLYVTHDFEEALAISDEIFIIDDKKIEIHGSPSEINKSTNKIVKSLKCDGDLKGALQH